DAGDPEKTRAMDIDEKGFLERITAIDTAGALGYVRSCCEAYGACESYQDLLAFKNGLAEFAVLTCQGARTADSVDRKAIISKKEQIIKRIYELPNESEAFSCLEQFIRDTAAKMQGNAKPVYSRLVSSMLSMAEERYSDMDLSLQYLAAEMKGNAAYLGRIFKNETGWSFNDYLSHLRTEKARELLRDTGMKGGEISEKVGFSNYNYFYLIFKKLTGMTPMDYRKRIQGPDAT
ncbi:MAG: helix-turn-helix domain-containing protein, partial [Lachnospiraceae bacterium]|nr:helix-turn-helix domain-containing protein [Lachnospiraceae bacterium]